MENSPSQAPASMKNPPSRDLLYIRSTNTGWSTCEISSVLGDDNIINLASGVGAARGEVVRGTGGRRPVNVASRDQAHLANFDQSDDKGDDENVSRYGQA